MPRRRKALILAGLSGMTWLVAASLGCAALADRTDPPAPESRSWSMRLTDGQGWTLLGVAMSVDHRAVPVRASVDQQENWALKIVVSAANRSVEARLAVGS